MRSNRGAFDRAGSTAPFGSVCRNCALAGRESRAAGNGSANQSRETQSLRQTPALGKQASDHRGNATAWHLSRVPPESGESGRASRDAAGNGSAPRPERDAGCAAPCSSLPSGSRSSRDIEQRHERLTAARSGVGARACDARLAVAASKAAAVGELSRGRALENSGTGLRSGRSGGKNASASAARCRQARTSTSAKPTNQSFGKRFASRGGSGSFELRRIDDHRSLA